MSEPFWAVACYGNSKSQKTRKWYRVSRMIEVDGAVFELYWHHDIALRGNSRAKIRTDAKVNGIELVPGVWHDAPAPRNGNRMERA